MYFIYNILILIVAFSLKIVAFLNKKINLFVEGRSLTFSKLTAAISKEDMVIWMHCASLGEFEQGRPILEKLREKHPTKKILIAGHTDRSGDESYNYDLSKMRAAVA